MTKAGAQDAVTASALIVGSIYLYRKMVEPAISESAAVARVGPGALQDDSAALLAAFTGSPTREPQPTSLGSIPGQILGQGPVAPVSRFVVGWGFIYVTLALIAEGAPDLGGSLALLVAGGAILGNGARVSADISAQLRQSERLKVAGAASDALPTVMVDYTGSGAGMMLGNAARGRPTDTLANPA